jgi:hypothetical protein
MKKIGVNLLILNLIISIFAFCFVINLNIVDGKEEVEVNPKTQKKTEISDTTPSNTQRPTSMSSTQKAIAWATSEDWVAPKGYEWNLDTKQFDPVTDGSGASGAGYSFSGIVEGAWWAASLYIMIKTLGGMFFDDEGKVDAVASAAAGGLFAGKSVHSLIGEGGYFYDSEGWIGTHSKGLSIGAGLIVAAIIFYNSYKKTDTEIITFTCYPWDAPTGGNYCEKCNNQNLPCSEYQCRSLGQSCQLVNKGTDEERCVWVNEKDVSFPIITPWNGALKEGYSYSPDNAISPPDKGVYILKSNSKCIGAFEPFSFGITVNEPAKCKIDYLRKETFDEMNYYFGGSSTLKYNHTQVMSLPGPESEENLTMQNNGNYELFVRCQDANGNYNIGNFVFKYCVEKGPDTTAPLIVATNLLNNMPISSGQTAIDLEVYINEPAECKWSRTDQPYDNMEEKMSCSNSVFEMNAQMLYKCKTKLTGLKDEQANDFYFRCKDQPTKPEADRVTNAESYKFTLIGTRPLVLYDAGPNETIKDSTETVKVTLTAKTSAGYNEGISNCYYSETDDNYIMFFNTDSYTHSQDLYLSEGDYSYYIKCIDLGGNSDTERIYFHVESDSEAPEIVRTFYENPYLKLITSEDATCVYDVVNCNYLFEDGISIRSSNKMNHFIDWDTKKTLYVKCKDEYGNQPAPDECNIVVKAVGDYM